MADDAPPMPDWAPTDGPWCFKQWIPTGVTGAKVMTCILTLGHEGQCRDQHGRYHDVESSLSVGQARNLTSEEVEEQREERARYEASSAFAAYFHHQLQGDEVLKATEEAIDAYLKIKGES